MVSTDAGQQSKLLTLAQSRYKEIDDRGVYGCWHVVVEAITQNWLTAGSGELSLANLIHQLETGNGIGAQEYRIDVNAEAGNMEEVIATFIDERYTCSRTAMLKELKSLQSGLVADKKL